MIRVLIMVVRLYQLTLASLFGGQCRFTPSCSVYAMEALHAHGAARGSALAAWRVLRCSPFCRGGHDPVPPVTCKVCDAPNPATMSPRV